jgi:hypothetical protein
VSKELVRFEILTAVLLKIQHLQRCDAGAFWWIILPYFSGSNRPRRLVFFFFFFFFPNSD